MLAMLLVVAQSLLLVHQVEFEEHLASHSCEACLHAGSLGSTHVADSGDLLFLSLSEAAVQESLLSFDFHRYLTTAQPRAPPHAPHA